MINYKYIFTCLTLLLFLIPFAGMVFIGDLFLYIYYAYAFVLFALTFIFVFFRKKDFNIRESELSYWILLVVFFGYLLLTAFVSKDMLLTVSRVAINFLPLFAFALVYSQSDTNNTVRLLMNAIVAITLFSFGFLIILHFFGSRSFINDVGWINSIGPFYQNQFGLKPFYRYSSIFSNPNILAMWMLFTVTAYEFTRFKYDKKRSYWMYIIYLLLLYFAFSRAGMLSVIIFYSVLIFLLSSKKTKSIMLVSTGLAGFAAVLLYLGLFSGISSGGGEERLSFSLNARDVAWSALFKSIAANPLVGIGFGVSSESILQPTGLSFSAHNVHLQMLSEIGIIGYVLFVIIYFYPVVVSSTRKQQSKSDLVLISFLIAFFIHQSFENTLFRGGLPHLLWFFFSCVLVYRVKKPQ